MTNVILNNVDHHDLRVIDRREAALGDAVGQIAVFPNEFERLQRDYPIVLRKADGNALAPVAILGFAADENLFLADDGRWNARGLPALIERGPFTIAAPKDADGEPMVLIDPDHPRVSRDDGEALFMEHGGSTPFLEKITQTLRTIYLGHHLVAPMVEELMAANLLQTMDLDVRIGESDVVIVRDIVTIDRAALARLSGDALQRLNERGFLQSAFMMAASLGNMQRLADLKHRRLSAT